MSESIVIHTSKEVILISLRNLEFKSPILILKTINYTKITIH